MFHVEELSKRYKDMTVLDGIDWRIERGEFAILTGRSGGGKTTLLSVIGGLARPDAGRVLLDDVEIWKLSEPELAFVRNSKLGFVFQFPSLLPALTVLDNILLPIAFSGRSPNREDRDYAISLLEMVGINGKETHYPSQLSGGQQRRAAIARAMINRPSILLADEPTGDLDEKTEAEIMRLFQRINQQGTTLVMVTHASDYTGFGNAYTLKGGRLLPYEEAEVNPAGAAQGGRYTA
ncbi:MAG: ABC transporter ATP-binding protein [Deltaproteobacteria bacterium]|jgi:ABC-type lipoprotein export system ATPase subunit|nr:ABC transporter ATP-binding protein [Deltaproteobacteria bacterium]